VQQESFTRDLAAHRPGDRRTVAAIADSEGDNMAGPAANTIFNGLLRCGGAG
jgi:hypothetical protein